METDKLPAAPPNTAFLDDLIAKRRKLIDALDANKGEVNLDIFEDFYPDRAHFVYELLQNAEDAGATQVTFTLQADRLVCEHDGSRKFSQADVAAITGIHNSTKDKAQDRIGKFGVGFKSVFVYTQSPVVRSGAFSFRIVEMILPEPVPADPSIGELTRFEFPFNNPKKPPEDAYAEIAAGLNDLDETTLLFLSNLQSIKWRVGEDSAGEVLRHAHSKVHFEVLKQTEQRTVSSSHFLKFDQIVPGLGSHRVAVAFPLDFLPGVSGFDAAKPVSEQLKIIPASQGRVAVFFIAAKETSGLLFHLHGPFVPELSRASIKESAANEPLFEQLSNLCAASLHEIKSLGLLTPEFLAILPNPEDQIPIRYQSIRDAIIEEMRCAPLVPTHDRSHAEGIRLLQARASLKNLLSKDDIEFLVEYGDQPPAWAIGVTQKNSRIDNFLSGLEIREWGVSELIRAIGENAQEGTRYVKTAPYFLNGPDEAFMEWLGEKSPDWLQQFYALLHDEAGQTGLSHRLKAARIVRLQDGSFSTAARSFFANEQSGERPYSVDPRVYTAGKSKPQQEKAHKFLLDLGVRELGEAEEVELILKSRYTKEAEIPDEKTYLRDLKRFVVLVEKQADASSLFARYYIFRGDDDNWYCPHDVYIDDPFKSTGLSAYYGRFEADADCQGLHASYKECGIAAKRLRSFAEAVGVTQDLKFKKSDCRENPQWPYLRAVGGDRYTSPRDSDYHLPGILELLKTPSLALSKLLWRTLSAIPAHSEYFRAEFRRSHAGGTRTADSRLVHELREARWIPQGGDTFVRPADASRELLPAGFPFDPGYAWLKLLQFGATALQRSAQASQKDAAAKSLGFADAATAERAKRFVDLPLAEQEQILADFDKRNKPALPDRDLANPQRRAQNVREQALKAPDKESETRQRSVSIGREDVKDHADSYLREHYRNAEGEVTCQICKGPLPFKLDSGAEYFEVVEFLPELKKRHPQNYLALCPNHSAMYRLVNGSKETIRGDFRELVANELAVVLAERELTIYFSKTHIIDLKAVLDAEDLLSEEESDEANDGRAAE